MAIVHITVYITKDKLDVRVNSENSLALQEIEMSRVPCVGEFVKYRGHNYKVNRVVHNLDFDSRNSLFHSNPEAFIDVSLCD
ncbi:hypothetical protein [Brunnivagina elsteri]|uniref:Uncharacterized protein n=1 Tax=Brunnivagina elsteri CCALA 953 TaxID=987040 RepID=A0A2A2TMM7_9CYAN|nr:hypothetical protein [Calothrix elsteri]PAX59806.1 hypothetical protein CK510_05380 [Calothrix elsteri CCALA 953]